jgi:hypothetical protein
MKLIEAIKDYESRILPCNPAFAPTMPEVIRLIDLYWNSRYRGGDYDENGMRKSFFNISQGPTWVKAKETDIDLKDIVLRPTSSAYQSRVWLLSEELRNELLVQHWSQFLNSVGFSLSKNGHVVVKKTRDLLPNLVLLKNFLVDPTATRLEKAAYVIEKFLLLPSEFALRFPEARMPQPEVNGYIPIWEIYQPNKEGGWDKTIESNKEVLEGLVSVSSLPYRETGDEEVPGRWMHRGTVEKLFENQIEINRIAQSKRMSMAWGEKQLFQTADPNVVASLVQEAVNGTVVKTRSPIDRIATEERNLSAYMADEQRWDSNTQERTFNREVATGERFPSGTRLGTVAIQQATVGNYFDLLKENFGLFIKGIIQDWVLPELVKKRGSEHLLRISKGGKEGEKINRLIVASHLEQDVRDYLRRNHRLPPAPVYQMMEQSLTRKVSAMEDKYVDIPDNLYSNLNYKVEVSVTGESLDAASRLSALRGVLDLRNAQPALLNDPVTKKIIRAMLVEVGLDPDLMEPGVEGMIPQDISEMSQGGTMPRPATSNMVGAGSTEQVL